MADNDTNIITETETALKTRKYVGGITTPLFFRIAHEDLTNQDGSAKNPSTLIPPSSSVVLARPLSMLEIDTNMFTLERNISKLDDEFDHSYRLIYTKAPIHSPTFTGTVTLPSRATPPAGNIANGTAYYNTSTHEVQVYVKKPNSDTDYWAPLATTQGLDDYLRKTGGVITGELIGRNAIFHGKLTALKTDFDGEYSSNTNDLDLVATSGWVRSTATKIVDDRLGGGTGAGITINGGGLTINTNTNDPILKVDSTGMKLTMGDFTISNGKFHGDIDMGTL